MYNLKKIFALILLFFWVNSFSYASNPKREFRGAWLHTVFQDQYLKQNTAQNKKYLQTQLDALRDAGINVVLFQVRPQADSFYQSSFEPWSRFLSRDGKPPEPFWDPLQFMIDECHARGMELHAWINPYRVTSSATQTLPQNHIYHNHPDWFKRYDRKLYFDPALPECRDFITMIVEDIITRYDVDGIHFDDYFYPYPVRGKDFPDNNSYQKFAGGDDKGDWRRSNVDKLIKQIHEKIAHTKPWVVFGVSPFGIWRNKTSDARGSETSGLQNYDDLYADVILWAENGWVDYLIPQLYWELEHKSASYSTLIDWWDKNISGANLYIGQSIPNTMSHPDINHSDQKTQLKTKISLARQADNIKGNCWWPGYDITKNVGGIADSLIIDYQATIALPPLHPRVKADCPRVVNNLRFIDNRIEWNRDEPSGNNSDIIKYVIYRFDIDETPDIENPENIEAITYSNSFTPDYPGVYIVTALNRANIESPPSQPITVTSIP